jgi:ligand-binding SRPBCC domain-containing protein
MVNAPAERCFDLTRSIDLHLRSTAETGEQAIGGVKSGLLGMGEQVTWRARHLGVWQTLTSQITRFDRPRSFRDSQVQGAFARFDHDHLFEAVCGGTRMTDIFDYTAPCGWLGRLAEVVVLNAHVMALLTKRAAVIKLVAESDEWKRYTPAA